MQKDMSLLENHIDDPIKKSVVGLSLLGFRTVFSCCGFNYKGEAIRKDHFIEKPYVFIDADHLINRADSMPLRNILLKLSFDSGWCIGTQVLPQYFDFHSYVAWPKGHPWSHPDCLHKSEPAVLAINRLEHAISMQANLFKDSVDIVDGNDLYKREKGLKYWQYDACAPWTVTKEMYFTL